LQVGLGEQQLGECDAHLPAAREFFGSAAPVALGEAETGQHRPHLRLDRIPVARAKFVLGVMESVGHLRVFGALGVELCHPVCEGYLLVFQLAQLRENRHAFGENAPPRKRQPLLREVADRDIPGPGNRTRVESLHPRQNLEQRGFTRSVRAHNTHPVLGCNHPVHVLKEDLGPVTFPGGGELDHRGA